jgi:hypothetical protein
MLLNLEEEKKKFENHEATFQDLGNIKILDFEKPGFSYYRIRFLFEEDYCRLHISGDLGHLIATNYNNMTYEGFSDFVHNPCYFSEKISCMDRDRFSWDYDLAVEELKNKFVDFEYDPEEDIDFIEDKINEILGDFTDCAGIGPYGFEVLNQIDADSFEYASHIGREETGIIELYLLAFELAQKKLNQ